MSPFIYIKQYLWVVPFSGWITNIANTQIKKYLIAASNPGDFDSKCLQNISSLSIHLNVFFQEEEKVLNTLSYDQMDTLIN